MPVPVEKQEQGKCLLREAIAKDNPHLTSTQVGEALAFVLKNERIKYSLEWGSDFWDIAPAYVSQIAAEALKEHATKFAPVPSPADYAAYKLPEMIKVFGEAARPDLMLSLYREAQGLSDAELIASGAPVGAAQTVRELDDTVKPLHQRDYSWHGWQAEIGRVTGQHPATVLPSRQREIIDKLKDESHKASNGGMHDADVVERARIEAKPETARTPSEKITLARLS